MTGPLARPNPDGFRQAGMGDGFRRGNGQDQVMGRPVFDPDPGRQPDPAEGPAHPAGDLALLNLEAHPRTSSADELEQDLKQLGFLRMTCEEAGQISGLHGAEPVSGR